MTPGPPLDDRAPSTFGGILLSGKTTAPSLPFAEEKRPDDGRLGVAARQNSWKAGGGVA